MAPESEANDQKNQQYSARAFAVAAQKWLDHNSQPKTQKTSFYHQLVKVKESLSHDGGEDNPIEQIVDFMLSAEENRTEGDKLLVILQKMQPYSSNAKQIMKSLSTLLQSAPFGVSIAFVCVYAALDLGNRYPELFNEMANIMSKISENIKSYDKYAAAYPAHEDIHDLLAKAYLTIINFWYSAYKHLNYKFAKTMLVNALKPIRNDWEAYDKELRDNLQQVSIRAEAIRAKNERQERVVHWILGSESQSKLDFRSDLQEKYSIHEADTCCWLFELPAFHSWYGSTRNSIAWYNAVPGSGKTIMSAVLEHHLMSRDQRVIYYRYSFDDTTTRKPLTALRSICLQLKWLLDDIPPRVMEYYATEERHHASSLEDSSLAVKVVAGFLDRISKKFPLYIIVDGLDECSDCAAGLRLFDALLKLPAYQVDAKWFFLSRPDTTIRQFMKSQKAVSIEAPLGVIRKDIALYYERRICNESPLIDCTDCIELLTATSEENFLYSKIMFNILCGQGLTCSSELHDELRKFPKSMSGCWMRCLEAIAGSSERESELMKNILAILVCAVQPLTLGALRNALAPMMDVTQNDFQADRERSLDVIKRLFGVFIHLDESSADDDQNRLVKFVHKSVYDFLQDSRTRLDAENKLQCFFVDRSKANLELGRTCLRYLQYRRYHEQIDFSTVLTNHDEHAFFKYAAAFWVQHLRDVHHSPQILKEVLTFIQSPAFWTCLCIQARICPHLFSRFTLLEDGSYAMGVYGNELSEGDVIGVPLPPWVDQYAEGQEIVRAFYEFVREWHLILTLFPEQIDQCVASRKQRKLLPWTMLSTYKNPRLFAIDKPSNSSSVTLADVFYRGDKLHARLAYLDVQGDGHWSEILLRSSKVVATGDIQSRSKIEDRRRLVRCGNDVHGPSSEVWLIGLETLTIDCATEDRETTLRRDCHKLSKNTMGTAKWSVLAESIQVQQYGTTYMVHLAHVDKGSEANNLWQRADSAYHSDSSDEDSDSDDAQSSENKHSTPCDDALIIVTGTQTPLSIPLCRESCHRLQISGAFHPSKQLAVWSQGIGDISILDIQSGEISRLHLEEPVDADSHADVIYKEMRFSVCGTYLDYLLVTFTGDGEEGAMCNVFLSRAPFNESSHSGMSIKGYSLVARLKYQLVEMVDGKQRCVLTYWDAGTVYLCLPPLSCDPKVLRISRSNVQAQEIGNSTEDPRVEILAKKVFFPSSTPSRNPKIIVANRTNKHDERLALAMDSLEPTTGEEETDQRPPLVMEWTLGGNCDTTNTWRKWDQDVDSDEVRAKKGPQTYKRLRGDFVATDRRFNVVARSSLNWNKQAFLSCF